VANTARESDKEYSDRKRLIQIVGVALEPERQRNAETVLAHVEPINQRHGFMAKVDLDAVPEENRRLTQTVLNAAMTLNAVQRHDRGGTRKRGVLGLINRAAPLETTYLIRHDLFKTLLLYRAGSTALFANREGSHLADQRTAAVKATTLPTGAVAGNRPLLANHHDDNGASHRSDRELEAMFRHDLVKPLGLSIDALDNVWDPQVAGEALAAANALRRQARHRPALSSELQLVESDNKRVLEHERDIIASHFSSDRRALGILDEVASDIERRIPALMLLPESGLIDRLIFALEEAHGENRLRDDEHLLLARLHALKNDLEAMNPKDTAAWKGIARQLEHLNDTGPTPTHRAGDIPLQ